ncbi:MAG: aminopeptidase [bacterium]|nr:aminopeptidase [bacterium]
MTPELKKAAFHTLSVCLGVKPDEQVAVVTDTDTAEIGTALFEQAVAMDAEAILLEMKPREASGQEPSTAVAAAMRECDVYILATKRSLSHTNARRQAKEAGARGASMPGVTVDMMLRTMPVDYNLIADRSSKLGEMLQGTKTLGITNGLGTDIILDVEGKEWSADTGLYLEPGDFGNLPAGEACAGVVWDGCNGVAVFDSSFADIGVLTEPIKINFKDGEAEGIGGGTDAERLIRVLDIVGPKAYMLAEIGIGTHHAAKITGAVLEDEKVMGTIHLALGNDLGFGGDNDIPLHLDGVIDRPTMVTDKGTYILKEGGLLIE